MNDKINWQEEGSLETKLFKLSFEKMLDFVHSTNELDEAIAESLRNEKPAGWRDQLAHVWGRIEGRLRFVDFRIAFELGHDFPLKGGDVARHAEVAKDLHQRGAITDERLASALRGEPSIDLETVQKYIRENQGEMSPVDESPGMLLCAFALSEIFMCSETVRNGDSIQYFQNGQLRAIAGVDGDTPNGTFEVFYPNGQTWMKGAYENGSIKPGAMRIFMPDGSEAKPARPSPALLH